ncbi:MAG TPA: hypothetical protein VFG20_00830, partial [Planctomycetaceae bacterium]|nr:hypothetical protein [Planctomycetaceae bacterium]
MTDGLTPQWVMHGASSSREAAVIIVAVLVAAALAFRSAWVSRATTSAAVVWGSFALRCGSLVVLAVLLFQPAWAWTVTTRQLGRIVIAVDASDSMQVADPHADPREYLQWGVGLGWLDPQTVQQQLADPIASRDDALAGRFATLLRTEIAARVVTDPQAGIAASLARLGDVELQIFAGEAVATTLDELPTLLTTPPADLKTGTTEMTAVLRTA